MLMDSVIETLSTQDMRTKLTAKCNHRIGKLREHRSTHRSPWNCAREREVIIIVAIEIRLVRREAMDQYIMCGLDVEGLFDLGIGSNQEMNQDHGREKKRKDRKCYTIISNVCSNVVVVN